MRRVIAQMQPCISVLTHISSDVTQPSLYLTAKNGQKYLIGRIGEGFQRAIGERSVRTSKLSGIFVTGGLRWDSVSGIPGMLLSFAERISGLNKLHVGPGEPFKRAGAMIESWNNFTFHQPLSVRPECESYSDENLEISPLTVLDSTSFVVQMKPVRGKFMVEKAKALGIPPGKLFGQLSDGHSVTVPETGVTVNPADVVGPSPIPSRVLVLDLPTMNHVAQASTDESVSTLLNTQESVKSTGYILKAVYWFFGPDVDLSSPEVAALIQKISGSGDGTKHFISHPKTSPDYNTLNTLAEFQSVFRREFPKHFSLLYSSPAFTGLPESLHGARILEQEHTLSIAPTETAPQVSKKKKAKVAEEFIPQTPKDADAVAGRPYVPCSSLDEPEVITLGTGASAPSKYRNVSGTLVRSQAGSVIFDSGEGTSNTLARIFGPEGRSQLLRELKLLYISHMHADHHLGAQQIIRLWLEEAEKSGSTTEKLVLAAPFRFLNFLNNWAEIDGFEKILNDRVLQLDLESVCIGNRYSTDRPLTSSEIDAISAKLGFSLVACTAIHCAHSYNVCVTFPSGGSGQAFKVSYSGDTRPNRFFAQAVGHGSDLLVHEATHENELAQEALKKRHSTIGEALDISKLMKAKNTILTHISQRYPRLPELGEGGDDALVGTGQYACFGFDAMYTKLSEVKDIQRMVPKMSELFAELEEAGEDDSSALED